MKRSGWTPCAQIILISISIATPAVARAEGGGTDFGTYLLALLIVLLVALVLFLAFREVLCWYWKVNEIVGLLRDIREGQLRNEVPSGHSGQQSSPGVNSTRESPINPFVMLEKEQGEIRD